MQSPDADTPVSYSYDPRNPVPTVGGNNLVLDQGPYDQSSVWDRSDVLVYQTDPLESDLAVAGNIWLRLYASSNRFDTDFTGKLVDIYPDGRKMLVIDGILMARHRLGYDVDSLLSPGQVYEFMVDLWPTAYMWPAGHRLGLAVSSSNHPRYRANPNVPDAPGTETDTLTATNTVYQDSSHPSALLLPVINGWNGTKEVAGTKPGKPSISVKPQPFMSSCSVSFSVARPGRVRLRVFDAAGRLVQTLQDGWTEAGSFQMSFGEGLRPGVFYLVMEQAGTRLTERAVKLR